MGKQGQDAIISAGNKVPLVIQRFGAPATPAPGTWKPQVELVGGPATTQTNPGQTYTKTSLAANPVPEDTHWDVRHNITAKGFQPGAPAPSMPQGLAANLARLAVRPQGPSQGPPKNQSQIQSPGSAAWEDKLNANVAGQAGNAEDFTKEFMKQLAGQ